MAEVQVFAGDTNVALNARAKQSSTSFAGEAARAVDGETDGDYARNSTTHTATEQNPWWECELREPQIADRVVLWNRTGGDLPQRLGGARLQLLDAERKPLFEHTFTAAPEVSETLVNNLRRSIQFSAARADYAQNGFPAAKSTAIVDTRQCSVWLQHS